MTTYITILDTQVDPDAPITSGLGHQFRDNPIAISEGASGAPYDWHSWHPYNGASVGDGVTGEIWSFATDGLIASIETPVLSDGFDYALKIDDLSTSGGPVAITIDVYAQTSSTWVTAYTTAEINPARVVSGFVSLIGTRINGYSTGANWEIPLADNYASPTLLASGALGAHYSVKQKCNKIRVYASGIYFDSGTVFLYRRKNNLLP